MLLSASPRIIPHLDPLPLRKGEEACDAAAAHCSCNRESDIGLALLKQFVDGGNVLGRSPPALIFSCDDSLQSSQIFQQRNLANAGIRLSPLAGRGLPAAP